MPDSPFDTTNPYADAAGATLSAGRLLVSAALGLAPIAAGLTATLSMKDKGNTNLVSGLVGAGVTGVGVLAAGIASYYILGVDKAIAQLPVPAESTAVSGLGYAPTPYGDWRVRSHGVHRGMGLITSRQRRGLGLISVTKRQLGALAGCPVCF